MTTMVPATDFAARLPRHVVSACTLITDPDNRILMLHQAHGSRARLPRDLTIPATNRFHPNERRDPGPTIFLPSS